MKSNCTSLFLNKTCLLLSPIQPWSVYFIKHTMLGIPLGLVTYHFNTIWKAFAGKHALFITSLLKRLGRTFYKVLQSITLFDLEYQKVNSQQTWLLWRQKKKKDAKRNVFTVIDSSQGSIGPLDVEYHVWCCFLLWTNHLSHCVYTG